VLDFDQQIRCIIPVCVAAPGQWELRILRSSLTRYSSAARPMAMMEERFALIGAMMSFREADAWTPAKLYNSDHWFGKGAAWASRFRFRNV
jgi:hypothetical protein